jgi:hypothetical protein
MRMFDISWKPTFGVIPYHGWLWLRESSIRLSVNPKKKKMARHCGIAIGEFTMATPNI